MNKINKAENTRPYRESYKVKTQDIFRENSFYVCVVLLFNFSFYIFPLQSFNVNLKTQSYVHINF